MKNIFWVLIFPLFIASCSWVIRPKSEAIISGKDIGSKLSYYSENKGLMEISEPDSLKPITIKLDSDHPYYLFIQYKEGYINQFTLIEPAKPNPVKFISFLTGTAIVALSALIEVDGSRPDPTIMVYALSLSSVFYYDAIAGNKKYGTKFQLPELIPVLKRKNHQRFLTISKLNVNLKSENFTINYFKNLNGFHKNNFQSNPVKKINIDFFYDKKFYYDQLKSVLTKLNFIEDSKKIKYNNFNSYDLNLDINKIIYRVISDKIRNATIDIKWKITDHMTEDVIVEFHTKETSDFVPLVGFNEEMIINIFEKSLLLLIKDSACQNKINTVDPMSINNDWEQINIKNKNNNPKDIASFVKSSLIIKIKDGHGSGIVISNDGYALSNYHVVGKNDSVEVIFSDNSKSRAKVIRTNPGFDLALIKINDKLFQPPYIDINVKNEIADEVIAIGTPKDIELGQTITKGIISGFRKFEDFSLIQTDTKVSPGNSGGPLINTTNSQLIGIINSKIIGENIEGIAFAIPINVIEQALKIKIN
ncbi:MAG: S1C family serine protease [Bacteroidota bacterium]